MTSAIKIGRVDITSGAHVIRGAINGMPVLSRGKGQDWTIEPDAGLADIVTVACALMQFSEQRQRQ